MVDILFRKCFLQRGCFVSVTTTREVFYGVISQEVAPYFFAMKENKETKICSFFGPQALPYMCDDFYAELFCAIVRIFEDGFHTFYFGGQGEFDALCHKIVTIIQEGNAPYIPIDRIFCVKKEEQLEAQKRALVPERYEDVICLPTAPIDGQKDSYLRDCAIIDASDTVLFCVEEKGNSSTLKAYRYAQRKGKKTLNLWEAYAPVWVPRSLAKRLLNVRDGIFTVE